MIDSYDEVPYPGYAYPQTHPDRLATIATLFGMNPPPVERCRVLDIGCGDGANLIPMAFGLPAGDFAGIDPAGSAIRRGKEMIAALGLRNVALERLDIRELDARFGRFDYIIAYGLYSWAPPEVQDGILAAIAEHLAQNGVAYVNFNAYPGGYVPMMMRDMLLDRLRGIEGSRARIEAARDFLRVLAAASEGEEWPAFMARQAQRLLERRSEITYHDELAAHYAPAWFRDFVAHAGRHGLQYLGEAVFSDMSAGGLSETAAAAIDAIKGVVEREQYMDFLKCRRFRQTLLCRAGIVLDRELKPERCADLWASSEAQPAAAAPDEPQEFRHPEGRSLTTAHPLAKSVMLRLAEAWPEPLRFDDVPERVALGTILLRAYQGAMVDLHVRPPRPAPRAGERPVASPVARYQLERGEVAATVLHTRVNVTGERERRLILLLDGTRDRAAIAGELGVSPDEVDRALDKIAKLGLLLA